MFCDRRGDRLTPYTELRKFPDGTERATVHLPYCCFPAYRTDGRVTAGMSSPSVGRADVVARPPSIASGLLYGLGFGGFIDGVEHFRPASFARVAANSDSRRGGDLRLAPRAGALR